MGMDTTDEQTPTVHRVAHRAKGIYRLTDFIVQRTLGTGSFGRVHLGTLCYNLLPLLKLNYNPYSTEQT